MLKYRNIYVLDGCWTVNNSYTVTNDRYLLYIILRDVILLLKSSCKWRECDYQQNDLYLVERSKIDPNNEFCLYYIENNLTVISQRHSHIKLPFLQNSNNRIDITNNVIKLNKVIQKIINELKLQHCVVDIVLESEKFILDILPWGWNGPKAHEPIIDWRSLRLLYITSYKPELGNLFNCGIDSINNIYFLYIESDNQLRNGPFGNNVHPDDVRELQYQFS